MFLGDLLIYESTYRYPGKVELTSWPEIGWSVSENARCVYFEKSDVLLRKICECDILKNYMQELLLVGRRRRGVMELRKEFKQIHAPWYS